MTVAIDECEQPFATNQTLYCSFRVQVWQSRAPYFIHTVTKATRKKPKNSLSKATRLPPAKSRKIERF